MSDTVSEIDSPGMDRIRLVPSSGGPETVNVIAVDARLLSSIRFGSQLISRNLP